MAKETNLINYPLLNGNRVMRGSVRGVCQLASKRVAVVIVLFWVFIFTMPTVAGQNEAVKASPNRGNTAHQAGDLPTVIESWSETLTILRTLPGTEREQARCLGNIGTALSYMGKYEQGIAKQKQALALFQKVPGAEREEATCYVNIGVTLGYVGKYEQEITQQEQALALFRKIPAAEREQAACHVNTGMALSYMGKYEQGIAQQKQALAIYEKIPGTEREQACCYGNIGTALSYMGEHEQALAKQEQALAVFLKISGTARERALCYGQIAWAHLCTGRSQEAINSFLLSYLQSNHTWWVCQGLARAFRKEDEPGDDGRAIQALLRAVELVEVERASVTTFEHRAGLFEIPQEAFCDFVDLLVELTSKKAVVDEPKLLCWSVNSLSKHALLEAAFHFADRGKGRGLEDALREKASLKVSSADTKLLAEDKELSLRISKLTSLREELPEAGAERRKKFTRDIEELQQRRNMIEAELKRSALGGYIAPEFRKPMEMVKELEHDTAVLQYSVGEKESWLLILTREGVTAHRIGAETPALPEILPRQEAVLEQLVQAWKERPKKVGLDGLVRLARARAEDLGRKVSERHNLIDVKQEQRILERLGEVVLPGSAVTELRQKGIRHLLVIPDGSLHYVPFAMLRVKDGKGTGKRYLLEEFAISYTPAMTTLDTIRKQALERERKRKLRRPLLAFANPDFKKGVIPSTDDMVTRLRSFRSDYYSDKGLRLTVLPETEKEAVRVGSLFASVNRYSKPTRRLPEGKAVVYTRQGASESQVKQLLSSSVESETKPQWRYILFSTHGLADTHNGMLSCIVLSSPSAKSEEDGFLQAQEVMNLELDTDLVMLSACQTGLGRMRGGEGLVGLSAAFFYAGSESVCASLWQVPTGPTGQLVTEFFKNLKAGKVNKAKALRQAQLKVMRQGRNPDGKTSDYSSPFCWAAFTLIGDWR